MGPGAGWRGVGGPLTGASLFAADSDLGLIAWLEPRGREEARETCGRFPMLMDGQIEWLAGQAREHGIDLDGSLEGPGLLEHPA